MTKDSDRIYIRRTSGKRALRSTLGVWSVVVVVFVVADPSLWPVYVGATALFALLIGYFSFTRHWVEPGRGVIAEQCLGFRAREVPLAQMSEVKFADNRAGGLLLGMRRPGRRRRYYVNLFVLGDYGAHGVLAEYLTLYADQLERWVPAAARGDVVAGLRKQVAHLESGGGVEDSPLAKLVTYTVSNIAKAGGAAGSTGLLK